MTDADRLRAALADLGMSQRALAERLEVSDRLVRYWASGQEPVPAYVWLALDALKGSGRVDRA